MNKRLKRLILPHGGILKNLMYKDVPVKKLSNKLKKIKTIKLSTLEFSDLIMIGIGAFSPLEGFMSEYDYNSVVDKGRLADSVLWPIPVTINISEKKAKDIKIGNDIALINPDSYEIVGMLTVKDIYKSDKKREANSNYRAKKEKIEQNFFSVSRNFGTRGHLPAIICAGF